MRIPALFLSLVISLAASVAMAAEQRALTPLEQAYARLLENPSDRELNLNYAALAMESNDYEAAIPPLERILMSEPGNAKIRLQIGVLYQALGSELMAREYFTQAKSTPGAPAAVVEEAKGYLHGL